MDQNAWIERGMLADFWYMFTDPQTLSQFKLGLMPLERPLWEHIFARERQWGIVYRYHWNDDKCITIGRFNTREDAMEMLSMLILHGAKYD